MNIIEDIRLRLHCMPVHLGTDTQALPHPSTIEKGTYVYPSPFWFMEAVRHPYWSIVNYALPLDGDVPSWYAPPTEEEDDMSFFSSLLGQSGQQTAMADVLQQVAHQDGGGIGALMGRFAEAGLGQHAESWASTGSNLPISADQIAQVFTPEEIEGWAGKLGVSPETTQSLLAQFLPHAVDHATADGTVPPAEATPNFASLIGRFFQQ